MPNNVINSRVHFEAGWVIALQAGKCVFNQVPIEVKPSVQISVA